MSLSPTELKVLEDRLLEAGLSPHQVAKALAAIDPVAVVLTRDELKKFDYDSARVQRTVLSDEHIPQFGRPVRA